MAEQDALPLDEIARELECQFNRFVDVFGREPTHIDSHHHVHMIPAIFPLSRSLPQRKGVAMRVDREVRGAAGRRGDVNGGVQQRILRRRDRRSAVPEGAG